MQLSTTTLVSLSLLSALACNPRGGGGDIGGTETASEGGTSAESSGETDEGSEATGETGDTGETGETGEIGIDCSSVEGLGYSVVDEGCHAAQGVDAPVGFVAELVDDPELVCPVNWSAGPTRLSGPIDDLLFAWGRWETEPPYADSIGPAFFGTDGLHLPSLTLPLASVDLVGNPTGDLDGDGNTDVLYRDAQDPLAPDVAPFWVSWGQGDGQFDDPELFEIAKPVGNDLFARLLIGSPDELIFYPVQQESPQGGLAGEPIAVSFVNRTPSLRTLPALGAGGLRLTGDFDGNGLGDLVEYSPQDHPTGAVHFQQGDGTFVLSEVELMDGTGFFADAPALAPGTRGHRDILILPLYEDSGDRPYWTAAEWNGSTLATTDVQAGEFWSALSFDANLDGVEDLLVSSRPGWGEDPEAEPGPNSFPPEVYGPAQSILHLGSGSGWSTWGTIATLGPTHSYFGVLDGWGDAATLFGLWGPVRLIRDPSCG